MPSSHNNSSTSGAKTSTRVRVAFREEIFSPQSVSTPGGVVAALQRIQRHVAEATNAARTLPILGGVYFPNVSITASNTTIAHKVQASAVSFLVCRPRGLATVKEVSQTAGTLTLAASSAILCDVWVFPLPSAQ